MAGLTEGRIWLMEIVLREFAATARYAVGSNARTARLSALMLIAVICWYVLL